MRIVVRGRWLVVTALNPEQVESIIEHACEKVSREIFGSAPIAETGLQKELIQEIDDIVERAQAQTHDEDSR